MGGKKIVLVDDEPDFVNNVKEYLSLYGYECIGACNGEDGLVKVEQERPQLLILDILMPNMDGYTMLRELRKKKIDIQCIVITAKGKLKDLFELERVDHFLTKPFELEKLKEIVDEILGGGPNDGHNADENNKGRKKKVLVIDDDKKLAANIRNYLEMKGYEVHSAFSGIEGFKAVKTYVPDVVVTDVMMPGLDGYSMIKQLRKENKNIPFIVLTGKERLKELIEVEGVDAFMSKPFDMKKLEENVRKALARK
ncbi:MAG: response regulator [Candidatus Omnitrophica bacterium]|nr:response regulator [Candidatus Omnitrophota bacterium]